MKPFLTFIGGFILGIAATIGFAYFSKATNDNGISMFPTKGKCLSDTTTMDMTQLVFENWSKIEVFQVVEPNKALANFSTGGGRLDRIVVLVTNNNNESYYDEQEINVSADKCVRQIGTYRYTTKIDQFEKTVPVVVIE